MEYRLLGRTGISVSTICLGTMMFGEWGNPDPENGISIIRRALDAGINFIDTADIYSAGDSERIVGRAIAGRRDDIVLATKFHLPMGDDPNRSGSSRRWIIRAAEDSLRRLGTDHIDLYQAHRPSATTDIEETLGALTDLVRQGKVRYLGTSTFPASQLVEADWASSDRHLERFVCEQAPYSMLMRVPEADVLPTCRRHRMGTITYSPLASGWLSGKYRLDSEPPELVSSRKRLIPHRFDLSSDVNRRKLAAADALAVLAREVGMSLIDMAIAFVLSHPQVTSTIVGPRLPDQSETYLAAADATLDAETLDRIDEIVAPGTLINPADSSYANPDLTAEALRRQTPSLATAR
jgi:aryl-alcohol dehydrogenase-like predicted oxidoreductase